MLYLELHIRIVILFNRYPGFKYSCKCIDKCFNKDQFSCDEYGLYGKNGCKYCRFMKCRNSAGMVDEWVVGAHSLVAEVTDKGKSKLIQEITNDQRGFFKNTENISLACTYDRSDTQPKRLKLCHTTQGDDKVFVCLVF